MGASLTCRSDASPVMPRLCSLTSSCLLILACSPRCVHSLNVLESEHSFLCSAVPATAPATKHPPFPVACCPLCCGPRALPMRSCTSQAARSREHLQVPQKNVGSLVGAFFKVQTNLNRSITVLPTKLPQRKTTRLLLKEAVGGIPFLCVQNACRIQGQNSQRKGLRKQA